MSTVGSMPAPTACAYWARPISPPSAHTAALFDMFWALNGATRTPRRAKSRHKPATSTLLPTDEAVPCTISTGAGRSGTAGRPIQPREHVEQPLAGRWFATRDADAGRQAERGAIAHD